MQYSIVSLLFLCAQRVAILSDFTKTRLAATTLWFGIRVSGFPVNYWEFAETKLAVVVLLELDFWIGCCRVQLVFVGHTAVYLHVASYACKTTSSWLCINDQLQTDQ